MLERAAELGEIDAALGRVLESGAGGLLLIEAAAGLGKSRLVEALTEHAASTGFRALGARGSEIERDYGYGVIRQLLGTTVSSMDADARERAFSGAASLAAPIFGLSGEELDVGSGEASLYGLMWLLTGLAEEQPLVLAVDDAHWADSASLRFLRYLGRRLDGTAMLVVLAARPNEPGAQAQLLDELSSELRPPTISPGALSAAATEELVRGRLGPRASASLGAACYEATGGNPLLIEELLADLAAHADGNEQLGPEAARDMGPARIAQGVLRRAGRLGPDGPELVRAAAVAGEGSRLRTVAAVAGIDTARAAEIADGLAAASILSDAPAVGFAHPLLRSSVYESIPAASREAAHVRTANCLLQESAGAEEVAAQLLRTDPGSLPEAATVLSDAAALAARRAAPDSVVAYLRRALEEPMSDVERAPLLQRLGLAEGEIRDPATIEHLRQAAELAGDPAVGIEVTKQLHSAMTMAGDWDGAVATIEEGLRRYGGSGLPAALELEATRAATRAFDPDRIGEYDEDLPALLDRLDGFREPDTRHLRWVIASIGLIRNEPRETVLSLLVPDPDRLELAEGDGWENPIITQMAIALLVVEAYERAHEVSRALGEEGRRRGSMLAALNAAAYAGALHSREGDLIDAEADIRIALDMVAIAPLGMVGALSLFCFGVDAIVERRGLGDVADAVIATDIPPAFARTATGALLDELKATVLAARGEREAAIARLRAAEGTWTTIGVGPRTSSWRSRLAVLLGHDDQEEAMCLAEEELALARGLGSARSIGVALRARGTVERGEPGIASLSESVAELRRAGARVELARSLAALGAAMRRERRTREARDQLREALELAQETGAERLEDHIFEELRIAGARPRRREVRGAGALTPAERRVVEAAAGGATNREIAQNLFVSLRTVEMHLTNAYRKLGISSREELAEAIAG